jgi:heme exporter protein A
VTRVELRACSKRFGERVAMRRVSLTAAPGETLVLVGANGSGKSTLLRIVAGLVRPTAGEALVNDTPAHALAPTERGRIGYVAHRALAYRGLTGQENLALFAALYRVDPARIADALGACGLAGRGGDRIDGYSRGMLQRLSLARIRLLHPSLLLLDEPATGLDQDGAALLDTLIGERRGDATILVSTHDGVFAERHADRIVTLAHGEIAG